jgi:hypothetical protein
VTGLLSVKQERKIFKIVWQSTEQFISALKRWLEFRILADLLKDGFSVAPTKVTLVL